MRRILKTISIAVLSLWAVFGFCLNINENVDFIHMLISSDNRDSVMLFSDMPGLQANFSGNNIVWGIVYVMMFTLIKKVFTIREKRLMICSLILATLFSIFQIVGYSIVFYLSIDILFSYFIITMVKLIGLIIAYGSIIIVLFSKLSNWTEIENRTEYKFFTSNKKSIIITIVILFVCWLPYLIKEFPGIITQDSILQIKQVLGIEPLKNWHILILFIKLCIIIGNDLFHSINCVVATYSIFQMILMATIFSIVIWYMAKRNISFEIRFIILFYFALCPTFPIMSLTMGKDTIFAGMMALSMIVFIEMIINTESLLKSKIRVMLSIMILVITTLFRSNALYMLIFMIPVFVILKKGYRIKIATLLGGSVVIVFIINRIVNSIIPSDAEVGMYCIPVQQISRVMVDYQDIISDEDKNQITKFFKQPDFYTKYEEGLSDPIMRRINKEYLLNNQGEFLQLWFRLLFQYPKSYIDGFLCMISGYLDPEESRISLWFGMCENDLEIEAGPVEELYFVNFAEKLMHTQNIPIIGMFFNTGFIIWIILTLLMFNIYQKQYDLSILFLPIILYWLTILLGPLNMEFRYIFYMFVCLPLLLSITIYRKNKKGDMLDIKV